MLALLTIHKPVYKGEQEELNYKAFVIDSLWIHMWQVKRGGVKNFHLVVE